MPAARTSIEFQTERPAEADLLLLPLFCRNQPDSEGKAEPETEAVWTEELSRIDELSAGRLKTILAEEGLKGEFGKAVYLAPGWAERLPRMIVFGCGRLDRVRNHRLEKALQKALKAHLRVQSVQHVAALLPEGASAHTAPVAAGLAFAGAIAQFAYRSREARKPGPVIQKLTLYSKDAGIPDAAERAREIEAMLQARARAQDLVNMPANLKRTASLAEEARELEALGCSVEIVEDAEWIREHMPCFYQVARGSLQSDPPRWIRVTYKPASGAARRKIGLVGKSVIFDTGGYQVKPDPYMNTMKADMTGGATVLGAMRAVAELKPEGVEVRAYCAATPNMIDAFAMTCDSIVDTACGKKVEIRHTDAEGRLTLIDAVTHAEREGNDVLVTVATLTGSAKRAVGESIALMSQHKDWRERFEAAALEAGDPLFSLDVVEEDFEDIASKLDGADISNVQQSSARGAQTAAAFVMSGARESQPLLHLDIAGGDMTEDEKATGIAVKSLLRFILNENG